MLLVKLSSHYLLPLPFDTKLVERSLINSWLLAFLPLPQKVLGGKKKNARMSEAGLAQVGEGPAPVAGFVVRSGHSWELYSQSHLRILQSGDKSPKLGFPKKSI